jgi:hypothetical protein
LRKVLTATTIEKQRRHSLGLNAFFVLQQIAAELNPFGAGSVS